MTWTEIKCEKCGKLIALVSDEFNIIPDDPYVCLSYLCNECIKKQKDE